MSDYDLTGIKMSVELEGQSKVTKEFEELVKLLESMGVKVATDIDAGKLKAEVNKARKEIEDGLGKSAKINPQLNQQAFSDLHSRIKKIRSEVNELSNVNIFADKNGNIQSAILTYQDSMGKLVTETMGYRDVWSETGELVAKVFETKSFKYTDNIAKETQELEKQLKKKKELLDIQNKIDNNIAKISNMKDSYGDIVDSDELNIIEDAFKSIDTKSDGAIDNIKSLNKEVKDLASYLEKVNSVASKKQTKLQSQYDTFNLRDRIDTSLGIGDKSVKIESDKIKAQMQYNASVEESARKAKIAQDGLYESVRKLKETKISYDATGVDSFVKKLDNIDVESEDAIKQLQNLRTEFTKLSNQANESSKAFTLGENTKSQLAKIENISTSHGRYDKSVYSSLKNEYESLMDGLSKGNITIAQAEKKYKELTPEVKSFEVAAKQASDTTNSLSDRVKRYFQFHAVGEGVQLLKRGIRETVKAVGELDASLVELQKVSDLTGNQLQNVVSRSYRMGESLAKTGKDVIDAVTVAKRAGFDMEDSFKLGEQSLVMTSVAEGIKNADDAASSLIAVIRGYGMEIDNITHIVDAFNEVSNTQAVNFDDLVNGATRISGVMKQQGNSYEEMLGMLTGGFEVLRDMEKVASGLQTVTMRIAGMDETGDALDPQIVSKLTDDFERLAGVSFVDTNGQIRDTYDILSDMAKVMPTLDRNTRQYLLELASGKRQANVLQSILDNWKNVEQATMSATNSAGSATQEMEKYLNSIEGKTNQLKSSLQELAIDFISSDTIKSAIDLTNGVVELTDACGGLNTVLLAVGISFTALTIAEKTSFFTKSETGKHIADLTAKLLLQKATTDTTTVSTLALSTAQKLLIGGAIVAGVMAIGAGLKYMSESAERAQQKVSDLKAELETLNSNTKSVADLSSQYQELSNLEKQQGLTNEEQEKFIRIQNELKELLPEVNGYYNSQGNFIISETLATEDLVKIQREYVEEKRKELALASQLSGKNTAKKYENEAEKLSRLTEYQELYNKSITTGLTQDEGDRFSYLKNNYADLSRDIKSIEEDITAMGDTHKSTVETMKNEVIDIVATTQEWTNLTEEQEDAVRKYISTLDGNALKPWHDGLVGGYKSASDFVKSMLEIPDVQDDIKKTTDKANESIGSQAKKFSHTAEELDDLTKKFKESTSNLQSLNGALQELDKNHSLSSNTITSLIDKYPDLLKYLDDETGMRQYLTEKISEEEKVHKRVLFNKLQYDTEYYNERIRGNEHLVNEIKKLYGVDLKNFNSLAEAKAAVEEKLINALGSAWARMYANNLAKFESQMSILDSRIQKGDIQSEKLMMQAHAAKTAVDTIRKASEFESVVVDFVAPSAVKLGDPKSKSSSSKSNLPKYLTQGFDDAIKEISSKGDELERVIERTNKKILNAQKLGNIQEELELQKQLEEMYAKRIALQEEMSKAFIEFRDKTAKELAGKKLNELTGINLESITEKQLADIGRKLDVEIDKANTSKNDKLANDLSNRKSLINEYASAIIDANKNINSLASSWWDTENERIERSIALLERKYELESKISNQKIRDLEYEQMLYEQDTEEYANLERQKLDVIYLERQRAEDMYNQLRQQGYDAESELVQKYHDLWYDYNVKIRQMQMETAKRNKENELKNLREKQTHTEQLISMTMDMLRSQYQEERELIEKNSKAKQDALNKELDGYRKIINERKKALQDEVREEDYQSQLDQYNKELADMESRARLLGKDETAVVEYEKLLEDIAKKEKEIKKHQRDYNIGLQQESLDKELSQYEDKIKSEIDNLEDQKKDELSIIDRTLKNEVRLREEAIRLIERKNKDLYNQLNKWAEENGTKTKEEIENAWNGAYDAINEYNQGQLDVLDTLTLIADKIKEVENSSWTDWSFDGVDNKGSVPSSTSNSKPSSSSSTSNTSTSSGLSEKGKEQLNQQKYLHEQMLIAIETNNEGLKKWIREQRRKWGLNETTVAIVKQFHTGINAGRIDGLKADEVVVKALNDEWFMTNKQMETLKKNLNSINGLHDSVGNIEISIDALMKDVKIDKDVNENELAKKLSDSVFKQIKSSFKIYGLRN